MSNQFTRKRKEPAFEKIHGNICITVKYWFNNQYLTILRYNSGNQSFSISILLTCIGGILSMMHQHHRYIVGRFVSVCWCVGRALLLAFLQSKYFEKSWPVWKLSYSQRFWHCTLVLILCSEYQNILSTRLSVH